MNTFTFKRGDEGCYADGVHGDKHLRNVLSNLVCDMRTPGADELADGLMSDNPDVHDEAVYETLELLAQHTELGLDWIIDGGDLLLVKGTVEST